MVDDDDGTESQEFKFQSVGEQLKEARLELKLELSDIAAKTRVPMRHLQSIEEADYTALPGKTYAIGFAKSYARAVDLSETKIGMELRDEMASNGTHGGGADSGNYEPTDPSRIPPSYVAWAAAALAVIMLIGYGVWRSNLLTVTPNQDAAQEQTVEALSGAENDQNAAQGDEANPDSNAASSSAAAGGDVVLTATDTVWLKIYDEDNVRLYENEMRAGDKYNVPTDAKNPQILTGRPDALTVTVGGQVVPPLGPAELTIKDVGVSAAALLARPSISTASGDQTNGGTE